MPVHSFAFPYTDPLDSLPLLDEEFDRAETSATPSEHANHLLLVDDLAWDDQLDNGEEMSL